MSSELLRGMKWKINFNSKAGFPLGVNCRARLFDCLKPDFMHSAFFVAGAHDFFFFCFLSFHVE